MIRKCLGFCYLFFCISSVYSQSFIYNKNFLHIYKDAELHIETDSQKEAVIFISEKTQVVGLENINSPVLIIRRDNNRFTDKIPVRRIPNNATKKLVADKSNSLSQISLVHQTPLVNRNIFLPKSSEYFTTGNHCNNSAVIPVSNVNLKIAVLSALYFNRFKNFSLEASFEKEYLSLLIFKVLINNHTVRPPPHT